MNSVYSNPPQPKLAISTYSKIPADYTTGQEIVMEPIEVSTGTQEYTQIQAKIRPVYVTKDTNELVYNPDIMKKGKKYYITWCGEHFALIKEDDGVMFYRFEAYEQ